MKELIGEKKSAVLPRLFVKRVFLRGADEVLKMHEFLMGMGMLGCCPVFSVMRAVN